MKHIKFKISLFKKYIHTNLSKRDGQLLIEILIAITVGSVFIIGATLSFVTMLRNNFENRGNQVASTNVYTLVDGIKKIAQSDWGGFYGLSKTSSNHYFSVSSATSSYVISGEEGFLFNDVSAGLIGHWGFDESSGSTSYDSSGKFNNGTLVNSPTYTSSSSCKVGGCLLFDGSSNYISIASPPNPSLYTSVTAWFKRVGSAMGGYHIIFMQGSQIEVSVPDSTGEIRTGVTTDTQNRKVFNSGSGVTDGNWHFLGLTYDGSNLRSYIDGVETASNSVSGAISTGSETNIGKYSTSYYANGYIDDVRIYNRALSADEIKAIYESSTYRRYFYVDNVQRDSNGSGLIITSGGTEDPSTQKLTGVAEWLGNRNLSFSTYLTRFRDNVFVQNSWGGGSGVDDITTMATTTFSTSINISASSTLMLATTTSSGSLNSVIFDTQSVNGSAVNSVMWQGDQPTGTSVQFQIAYSNSTSGPWADSNYVGSDGTSATYFVTTGPGIPKVINIINNYRYLRYKVILIPDGGFEFSPMIDSVSVNWSP